MIHNRGRGEWRNTTKIMLSIVVVSLLMMPLLWDHTVNAVITNDEKSMHISTVDAGWIKHFEGTSWGHTVIQTSDGGYLVGGGTGFNDGSDAVLLKTDGDGNKQWQTTFGNSLGWDAFEGLVETSDGGFAASGTKAEKGFLAKVDKDGNKLWEKTYGGSTQGYCIDVRQTEDEGFILAGIYYSEPRSGWLIRTDNEGNELWAKTYGGGAPATIHTVRITSDGGFVLIGWKTPSEGLFDDGWAVKTDREGNIEWENTYAGGDFFHSGLQTSDGGYIFTGGKSILNPLNTCQLCLVKTDAEGNEVWRKDFGTPYFSEMSLWIEETKDGGFIIIGHFLGIGLVINYVQNGAFMPLWSKIWLLKTDRTGNVEWDNKLATGYGRCVKPTSDNGFIIAGHTGSYNFPEGIVLVKTDENGNIG